MEQKGVYQVILVETPIHPYCKILNVIDIETGEVLLSKTEGNVQAAFANGYNACQAEVIISREINQYGAEYREVRGIGQGEPLYCKGWMGASANSKRRLGGKRSYVKTYCDRVLSLPDNLILPLLKLSQYVNVEGKLVDSSRRRPLKAADFGQIWCVKHSRCFDYIQSLKGARVLISQAGAYYLNKDYIGRG